MTDYVTCQINVNNEWRTYLVNLVAQHCLHRPSHLLELLDLVHLSFLASRQYRVDL